MTRLILTFTDSGAGALRAASLADCVIAFGQRLVWGRLPSPSELNIRWFDNLAGALGDDARSQGLGLPEFCAQFDGIDLWADPDPNSQLQLIWLLDHFRADADLVSKLGLVQTDFAIGDQEPDDLIRRRLQSVGILDDHFEIATKAWAAWCAPTPEAWFDILGTDMSALPQLSHSIVTLLEELPQQGSGLSATEMRMLELVSGGHVHPCDLFPGHEKPNARRAFGYWEVGALLEGLANCPAPAVSGLDEGPFDLDMHEDRERHDRYKHSRLALTELGQAILAGNEDFTRHNPVHCWWGGTLLTNDRLWRWDPDRRCLIAPAPKP